MRARYVVYTVVAVALIASFAYLTYTNTRRVSGVSMIPTLETGDLVVIQNVSISSLHVGDIIVYGPPCSISGLSVIHRVYSISSEGLTTKGDNNPYTDQAGGIASQPIVQKCIIGKVVFVIPYLERLSDLPYGLNYVLAALIIIVVLASEFYGGGEEEDGEVASEEGGVPAPAVPPTASPESPA